MARSPKITHGDVKTANTLVDNEGNPRLSDFGLSWMQSEDTLWMTTTVNARGSVRWMAPELLDGNTTIPMSESDVYAFAMTVLEILTGKVPYHRHRQDGAVLMAVTIRKELPNRPTPREVVGSHLWHVGLEEVWRCLTRCWDHDPIKRPSMADVEALFRLGGVNEAFTLVDTPRMISSHPFCGHTEPVTSVAFSPNGAWIASGSEDKTVLVWNADTGAMVSGPFRGHTGSVTWVLFTADSKRISRDVPSSDPLSQPPASESDNVPPITITEAQVRKAIARLKPRKATGPDGIPNVVLVKCAHILVAMLTLMYNASFRLRYMPMIWINTNTVPPKKPGKTDYSSAKSYRPVEIAANLRRLLGAIISLIMTYTAEEKRLLPANQFGARPGRSTTDALHLMVHKVKEAWRRRHVMAALFLDVKGAFNSVNIIVLERELLKAGYPPEIAEWYKMQTGRYTTISFDDFTSEPYLVETGVMQGVADSGNAYLAYQAPLLAIPRDEQGESAIGFVDDVCILAEGASPNEANAKLIDIMIRPGGVLEWARSHDCEFELTKSAHLLWSRKNEHHLPTNPSTPRCLTVGDTPIPTVRAQRVLGVIVDDQLNFHEHGNRVVAAGAKWMSAYRRLSSAFNGIPPKYARLFYLTVAVPRIFYGASVFLQPPGGPTQGSAGLINRLARVQRQAALQITGAMKTTASDVVTALADLPPFPLLVRRLLYRETIRLASLPPTNPIYRLIRYSPFPIAHKSPLHILPRFFNIRPAQMEHSPPFLQAPDWIPSWSTIIDANQEDALAHANNITTPNTIFSDGSVIDNRVGSACVLYSGGDFIDECRTHIGPSSFHTIFEAELLGIVTSLDLYIKKGLEQSVTIGVDSQAAIRALERTGRGPAARIIGTAQRQLLDLANKGIEVTIQWIPGHVGVDGNERVDRAAKEAAQDTSLPSDHLPTSLRTLPRSAAAHGEEERQRTRDMIARSYFESSRSHIISITNPTIPSRRFMRVTQNLSRTQATIIAQLVTGHIGLNYHLHRIRLHHTPACPRCGHHCETPLHFLVECPAYEPFRTDLRKKLKRRASDLTTLVTNTKTHHLLFRFIHNTGRFPKLDWTPRNSS